MTKPRNIKDVLFNLKKQEMSDKEFNGVVFQMENKLSDAEMEYIRIWFKLNKGKEFPPVLKFPNNEIKVLKWDIIR